VKHIAVKSIPAVKGQSLIHWNLHLLAHGSGIYVLARMPPRQERGFEQRAGKKECKGDDSGLHSSDCSAATIKEDRNQEEEAMVAAVEMRMT